MVWNLFFFFLNIFHLFIKHQCGSTVLHCSCQSEHNVSLQKMAPNSVQFYYLFFVQYILFWYDFCTESEPSRTRYILVATLIDSHFVSWHCFLIRPNSLSSSSYYIRCRCIIIIMLDIMSSISAILD